MGEMGDLGLSFGGARLAAFGVDLRGSIFPMHMAAFINSTTSEAGIMEIDFI